MCPGGAVPVDRPETTVVQLDPFSVRRRPDPDHAEPLFQSLEDRLLFRQARAILAGLTDCGHVDAARSLRATAAGLNLDIAALAKRFLGCLAETSAEPAKSLLLRIAVLALLPDGAAAGRGPSGRDVTPAEEPGVGGGEAEPAGAISVAPLAGGLSLHGVLDAATVPLLHARTRPVSVARAIRSSNGEGFQLDLAGLTHLDGAGLRALGALATRVGDGGSTLRVTTPSAAGLRDFSTLPSPCGGSREPSRGRPRRRRARTVAARALDRPDRRPRPVIPHAARSSRRCTTAMPAPAGRLPDASWETTAKRKSWCRPRSSTRGSSCCPVRPQPDEQVLSCFAERIGKLCTAYVRSGPVAGRRPGLPTTTSRRLR
jgi:anti-anti-sigma regulatory factor